MNTNSNMLPHILVIAGDDDSLTIQNTQTKAVCFYPSKRLCRPDLRAVLDGHDMSGWELSWDKFYIEDTDGPQYTVLTEEMIREIVNQPVTIGHVVAMKSGDRVEYYHPVSGWVRYPHYYEGEALGRAMLAMAKETKHADLADQVKLVRHTWRVDHGYMEEVLGAN